MPDGSKSSDYYLNAKGKVCSYKSMKTKKQDIKSESNDLTITLKNDDFLQTPPKCITKFGQKVKMYKKRGHRNSTISEENQNNLTCEKYWLD